MRILLALVLVGVLLAPGLTVVDADIAQEQVVRTQHLDVRGRVPEATIDEAATLGEALYAHCKQHFNAEPAASSLPLRLTLHPTVDSFRRELARRRTYVSTQAVGGYTWFDGGGSHVVIQRNAFDTRRLVIHELTHQFQSACRPPWRRGRSPTWYREGLAEFFGWHRRTPQGVAFGVLDLVAPTRRAHEARERVRNAAWEPMSYLAGHRDAEYPDALALVGGLLRSDDAKVREAFRRWELTVLRQGREHRRIREAFPDAAALKAALRATWDAKGPRWGPAPSGWDEGTDGWIHGSAGRRGSLGRRFAADEPLVLHVRPEAGAVVRAFLIGGVFTIVEWRGGAVRIRGRSESWPAPKGARLEVAAAGTLRLFVDPDGPAVVTVPDVAPGRWHLRLFVRTGLAAFRVDEPPADSVR